MKPQEQKSAPAVTIDEGNQFAWMRMVAVLVWGGEPQRMDHALATYSAELISVLHRVSEQPSPPMSVQELGRRLGIRPDEIARMPGSAAFYGSFFAKPMRNIHHLIQKVFAPAGHFGSVAEAPGSKQLVQDFRRAIEEGAFHAGVLLTIIAMLARRHPGTPASLNRAIAVMEGWSDRKIMKVPTDRTLVSQWKNWRHVAPLWAALIGAQQEAQTVGLAPFSANLEVLHDPARLSCMLGHAKWFRSFAVSFVPEHATGPLVPAEDAVQVIADAQETEPSLADLLPADLAAAVRYRAPTRKFFP